MNGGVTILTLHSSDDARVFSRQARALAAIAPVVRLVAARGPIGMRDGVEVVTIRPSRSRAETFLVAPIRLLHEFLRRPTRFVYLHDAPLLFLAPVLAGLGFEVVYDVHEDYGNMLRHRDWIPATLRGPAGFAAGWYERVCARSAAAIAAATAPLLEKFPHREKVALYNLPTRDFVQAGARQTQKPSHRDCDVVHLGSLSDARLAFLTEMLQALAAMRPGIRALVVGLLPHQVRRLRDRFPSSDLTIVERAPYAEVPALLGRCKVGLDVHPWLLPHLALAVPVKVFEYLACGCAVVTSHLPELERLLEPSDLALIQVVRSDDPARYAEAVASCLADPDRLDAVSDALRERVAQRYTWDREQAKLVGLFERLGARPETRRARWIRSLLGGRA